MNITEVLTVISLIAGVTSIVLAITAMIFAKSAEKDSKENFVKTQTLLNDTHEKTKDLLHQIDIKSAIINEVVQNNMSQLTALFMNVLDKVLEPSIDEKMEEYEEKEHVSRSKETNDEFSKQIALQLLPELLKDPKKMTNLLEISEKLKRDNK
jgi:hypothetical protein